MTAAIVCNTQVRVGVTYRLLAYKKCIKFGRGPSRLGHAMGHKKAEFGIALGIL